MPLKTFEHRTRIPGTAEQVMAFYATPNAPIILTPPPTFFRFREDRRTSLTNGEIDFTLWLLFIPLRWTSRHAPGPTPTSFVDRMLTGPMKTWNHTHLVRDVPGGVEIIDRIQIEHKPDLMGVFTRLFFDGLPLRLFFIYRAMRTRFAIRRFPAGNIAT
jgi:ligand-binding SRPBCC domain-containing protein